MSGARQHSLDKALDGWEKRAGRKSSTTVFSDESRGEQRSSMEVYGGERQRQKVAFYIPERSKPFRASSNSQSRLNSKASKAYIDTDTEQFEK